MTERRRHVRTAIGLQVTIDDSRQGPRHYRTRDISDGGMFVLVQGAPLPPMDSVVDVQIQGIVNGAPLLRMRVVRGDGEGFGLQLCDGPERSLS
ncbi:MAG: PilZ domain-containing protein [Gammaproteobacteria bacterium]